MATATPDLAFTSKGLFISGEWVGAHSRETSTSVNPQPMAGYWAKCRSRASMTWIARLPPPRPHSSVGGVACDHAR